jgi:hypothetical protein
MAPSQPEAIKRLAGESRGFFQKPRAPSVRGPWSLDQATLNLELASVTSASTNAANVVDLLTTR